MSVFLGLCSLVEADSRELEQKRDCDDERVSGGAPSVPGDALFSERRFVMTWLRLETLAASRLIAMLCAGLAGCWSATDKTSQRARSPRKTRRRTDGVRLSAGGGLRLP